VPHPALGEHVILLGLRGSGKTTVGRLLARRLSSTLTDLDDRTPLELFCNTVADVWAAHGEAKFREAETAALSRVLAEPACVIALGGGTPTAPGAASLLEQARAAGSHVIYLRAAPATLARRLRRSDNTHRPSLTGKPATSLAEIEPVFAARDPLYRSIATACIEIDALTREQVVEAATNIVQASGM